MEMPSAALWAYSAENYLYFRDTGASADAPVSHFHERGRRGKRHLHRRFLRKRGAAGNPLSHRCAMPAPPRGRLNSLSQNLTVLPAPSEREPLAWRESIRLKCKAYGRARSPGGAVAQRLRGFKSAEPKKTVKRSSRRTGVNLQFFPV